MHCNNCGENLNDENIFCPLCGVRQTAEQPNRADKSDNQSAHTAEYSIYQYEPLWDYWRIKGLIGSGAYGKVYLAYREEYERTYYSAVKQVPIPQYEAQFSELYAEGLVDDEVSAQEYYKEILSNILKEVKTNYELKGLPNIVLYEDHMVIERPEAQGYDVLIKMELLTSLNKLLRNQSFSEREAARLGIDICTALETLNKKKIIHRDIKPANIFVDIDGSYKLGDFGIARHMEKTVSSMSVKGTFAYMPPEIQKGEKVDCRADIYSLGLVLYRILNANRAPFLPLPPARIGFDENNLAIERRMKGEQLPEPQHAGAEMSRIILKACSYNKEDRWQDASALKQALEEFLASTEPAESGKPAAGKEPDNNQNAGQHNKAVADIGTVSGDNNETVDDILDRVLGKGQKPVQPQQFKQKADKQAPGVSADDTVQTKNENLTETVGLFDQTKSKKRAAKQKRGQSSAEGKKRKINDDIYTSPEAAESPKKSANLRAVFMTLSMLVIALAVLNVLQFLAWTGNSSKVEMLRDSVTSGSKQIEVLKDTVAADDQQIEELKKTIASNDEQVKELKKTIETKNSKISSQKSEIKAMQDKVDFLDEYVAVVSDDNTKEYHKYGCEDLNLSRFWIYNVGTAEKQGYSACPKCCDND